LLPELDEPTARPDFSDEDKGQFRRRLLEAALRHARPKFRERTWLSFTGRVFDGLSAAAVASDLGIRESAVYVNTSRVVSQLREFCAFHGEDLTRDELPLPE
jgi:DNA-directed RNA polymerase specialized sigma24 family protein